MSALRLVAFATWCVTRSASRSVRLVSPLPHAPVLRAAVRSCSTRAAMCDVGEIPAELSEGSGEVAADATLESEFLRTLQWRGFIAQATNLEALDQKLAQGRVVAYLGFDATANSLHVGSLLQIMLLRHFQRCGHKPIVLVGGGTTKVGDPSGKDASRQVFFLSLDPLLPYVRAHSSHISAFNSFFFSCSRKSRSQRTLPESSR